jgi:parallel beta-helix repeat protein
MRYLPLLGLFVLASPLAAKEIKVAAGPDAQERLQGALIEAAPGDVIAIGAGRFDLTDGLSLDVDKVTVRGAGPGETVLSFKGQLGAGEGLLVTSDDVTLRDFAVEDSKGDGIKSKGADRIVYKNVRVEWTGGPKATNGAYGVYPVESKHVLVDGAVVRGASDAGIYVGQSSEIIVRNSTVERNVAGIEIENSRNAVVHDNLAAHNTGGILVFDLPNLPVMNGGSVRVARNRVIDNDTPNFAPKGNIVASVRMGTGVLVMANENVMVTENELSGNATSNVMVIAYRQPYTDARYNPLPRGIAIVDNRHGRAGFAPQLPGGEQLAAAFGGAIPPILWDGAGPPAQIRATDGKVLSMGLAPGMAETEAKPAPVDLAASPAIKPPGDVILPAEMEARAK